MAERGAPTFDTLGYEVTEGVATLTLRRPDVLNSFDRQLKEDLLRGLRAAGRDREVRALVLTGAGRAFSAGQDLKERQEPGAADLGRELRERYNPLVLEMRRMEKPIVGAINGVAAGAGCSIALACDLRIASEAASFIVVFGRVGLVPDSGLSWILPRLVGPARAAEMAFTADPVDAATAERIGLVNRVVPAERVLDEARSLAVRLANGAPLALALAKRAFERALDSDLPTALEYEAQLQGIAGRSRDHAEGVAAFAEKRPARFTGD